MDVALLAAFTADFLSSK